MAIDLNDNLGKTKMRRKTDEPVPIWKSCLKFLFSHVGLFILVGGYAVMGAYIFISMELPDEEMRYQVKKIKAEDLDDSINFLADHFLYYESQNMTDDQWKKQVIGDLGRLKDYVITLVGEYKYDGEVEGWNYDWTFSKALLFTITIMTTIGYGHITPKTFAGQIFVIIYAIVGIPLMLVFLANIGDSMATWLKYSYSRICCRWCRARRKESELPPGVPKNSKGYRLVDEEVGNEIYMPTDDVVVPIVLNMVILALYLVIGACLFNQYEGWSLATASYFTFVTISTIGFGDYVPGNSFLDYKDGFTSAMKMVVTVMYCIIGLALVSMAINLIQAQLVTKVQWAAKEIGIAADDEPRIPIEFLRREARKKNVGIMETPQDNYGKAVKPRSASNKPERKRPTDADSEEPRPSTANKVALSRSNSAASNRTQLSTDA